AATVERHISLRCVFELSGSHLLLGECRQGRHALLATPAIAIKKTAGKIVAAKPKPKGPSTRSADGKRGRFGSPARPISTSITKKIEPPATITPAIRSQPTGSLGAHGILHAFQLMNARAIYTKNNTIPGTTAAGTMACSSKIWTNSTPSPSASPRNMTVRVLLDATNASPRSSRRAH